MIIKSDPDLIFPYLEDYSNLKGGFCDSVIFPETEQEIAEVLRTASLKKTPLTLSAAGTGVTGGRIPFGGSVLSLEKMSRILDIKKLPSGEGEATVEAGVILDEFLKRVETEGFFYPPNPTERASSIGGNIATSASGARSFRFGTTREYVLGLRIILTNGDIVELERGEIFADKGGGLEITTTSGNRLKLSLPKYSMPAVKNSAGYYVKEGMDAVDLFIGSEGTLGVVTRARLKLLEKIGDILDCYAFFDRLEDALTFVSKARQLSIQGRVGTKTGINAISLEFYDQHSLQLLKKRHSEIPTAASAAIYFEQESSPETEIDIIKAWSGLLTECGGSSDNTWFAQTKKEVEHLQGIRHDLPDLVNEFVKKRGLSKVGTDIAVSSKGLDGMIQYYNKILTENSLRYLIFGHIGDSHLHVNILPENKEQHDRARGLYTKFISKAISLGGTISAEHGIGKVKHPYLEMMYGRQAIRDMALLKRQLDPACILGLDNIFPRELLKQE